ncbi:sensor histidine kinase [Desulfonatronovibrio hydrogenovorans]|uniref:sensor histidine kinase n=1 Tax=Desulfonatronovibrio hydrogenovorans TaxID=53245 RepID=UPI00068FAB71|nr:HAMP domain-containing sensor histidine kinase [Desulfonatronovibrio hydrogenovorans]
MVSLFQVSSANDLDYKDPFKINEPEVLALAKERDPAGAVLDQHKAIGKIPLLRFIIDTVPHFILILNDKRQAVLANQPLLGHLNVSDYQVILGQRPGELMGCIHALQSEDGCGTTQFCNYCGAFQALLGSLEGSTTQGECRIMRGHSGYTEAMDFAVKSAPFAHDGQKFIFFHLTDISQRKRKQVLERIFFHDILNGVGGVMGALEIAMDNARSEDQEMLGLALNQTKMVIEEIQAQRSLNEAEAHELAVNPEEMNTLDVLKSVQQTYSSHSVGQNRSILIPKDTKGKLLTTDLVILSRVVGNMLKNALEASAPGDMVELGTENKDNSVVFWVRNSQVIPEDVQLQLFKRFFSTKGEGRGLGTHSIKLLTEEYLKGRVWFVSDHEHGTVFYAELPLDLGLEERNLPEKKIRT